ncbi:hypothetical protein HHI36_010022 [Cryptolaemus montrouzieri]|uniref:Uncharacterized protein n=1 Tax=Cryptolaemus montrouzieri TaxID=559131 RepID=A0ABD2MI83_9CUCU
MGIKYLWTILTPFCERKPLYELQGKTVAVDLSCWICEAQNISEYQVQPKMYLRRSRIILCLLKSRRSFGRNKIIALALLCDSDYSEGVQGVGKDCSLKLFEKYLNEEILDRMRQWRNQPSIFEEFERKLGVPSYEIV